jgi:hypothetical protein
MYVLDQRSSQTQLSSLQGQCNLKTTFDPIVLTHHNPSIMDLLLFRNMEDFVTWVDSSKIKQHVMNYNDEVRFCFVSSGSFQYLLHVQMCVPSVSH